MILVDSRAGSSDLVLHPPLDDPARATLCRLDSADVAFSGNGPGERAVLVGIEIKSLGDLVSSLWSGRLQAHQVPAMLAAYDRSYLVWYGGCRPGRGGELQARRSRGWVDYRIGAGGGGGGKILPWSYLQQSLHSLTAAGVTCVHLWGSEGEGGMQEVAAWVGECATWWGKRWGRHRLFAGFNRVGEASVEAGGRAEEGLGVASLPGLEASGEGGGGEEREARRELVRRAQVVAAAIPDFGYKRAMAAARRFGSVREMVGAGEREWREVERVGKVLAKRAVGAWDR